MSTSAKIIRFEKQVGGPGGLGFIGAIGIHRVGAALSGRFTVLKQLAVSEGAEFYLARPVTGDQKLVRIKVLGPRAAQDARKRRLFGLEAGAASKLKHVSITRTSEAVVLDGINLSIIEHRPWTESLRELLRRRGWLTLEHAARIINQIGGAIDYAHEAGVLHLRLTPDSILIEPNGHVLVTDFGIGAGDELAWAHKERSRGLATQYCSVEQASEDRLDRRSDIYSLGVLLYEMLTDRLPFDSHGSNSLKRKMEMQGPLPAHVLSTDVPVSVSNIVMEMLEREADKRPSTASQLQEALRCVMNTTIEATRLEHAAVDAGSNSSTSISERVLTGLKRTVQG
jgi:serine/threonine protein kinase